MRKLAIVIVLTMIFSMILSGNVLAAKASKDLISDDERIIKQFSVADVKLGMSENEAAIKLKKFAKKLNGVLFDRCVSKNQIAYICVSLSDKKITSITFHAAFLKVPYSTFGMDKEIGKKMVEKKYKIKLNDNYSYEGDKINISLSEFDINFELKDESTSANVDNND